MSKITLSGNASGTGTFTLASPNSNSDRTLNLPDAGGTMVLDTAPQTLTNKDIVATQLTGDVAAARITNALNASGSAPVYAARAWVNFDGTGTPAIRASGNVSSITDNGTGDYTVNFTTAMVDANYEVNGSTGGTSGAFCFRTSEDFTARTSSLFRVSTLNVTNLTQVDPAQVNFAIFR